jgi:thymidylate synthase
MGPPTGATGAPLAAATADELVRAVVGEVHDHGNFRTGADGQDVMELLSVGTVLTNPRARLMTSELQPSVINPGLAVARFLYLLSGSNSLDAIAFYSPAARRFSDDGLTMPGGSHGFRLFRPSPSADQFARLLDVLRREPARNRGAVTVYFPDDCGSPTVDLTCVMGALFTVKSGELQTLVTMRANDALRLLWYDLFEFSMLGEFAAAACGHPLGAYYHSSFVMMLIGSTSGPIVSEFRHESVRTPPMAPMPPVLETTRRDVVRAEAMVRSRAPAGTTLDFQGLVDELVARHEPYWADLLVAAALQGRWVNRGPQVATAEIDRVRVPDTAQVSELVRINSVRMLRQRGSRPDRVPTPPS